MGYAENTSVPIERSQSEIKKLLQKSGAHAFMFAESRDAGKVAFELMGRRISFLLPMPKAPLKDARGAVRLQAAWEQSCKSRWRCLTLTIKAKLTSIETGIETVDQAFMAHIALPDGTVVGDHVLPTIEQTYATGKMLPLLEAPK